MKGKDFAICLPINVPHKKISSETFIEKFNLVVLEKNELEQ